MIDGNVLDSFFVALGFTADMKGIDTFQAGIERLRGFVLKLGAALSIKELGMFVEDVAKEFGELQHFADIIKLDVREVAAWNRIAEESMVPPDAMQASMKGLTSAANQAARGFGRGAAAFKHYGISAKNAHGEVKKFGVLIDDLITKHPDAGMMRMLHLDPRLLPLLERGSHAIHQMLEDAKASNPFQNADYRRGEEVTLQLEKVRHTTKVLKDLIAVQLLPYVQEALDKFLEWYRTASKTQGFRNALEAVREVAAGLWKAFLKVSDALAPIVKWLGDNAPVWAMKDALYALLGVVTVLTGGLLAMAVAQLAALWPWYLIAAAIIAVGVAFYKWWQMMKESFAAWGQAWDWILDKIVKVIDAMETAWDKTKKFLDINDDPAINFLQEHIVKPAKEAAQAAGARVEQEWNSPLSRRFASQSISHSRAVTINHQISGTTINISSPDPERAGEKVKEALRNDTNRRLVRNSQGSHF